MGSKSRPLKVLVTGGQGFVGSALLRELVADERYLPLATARREAPELESLGIEVRYGDLRREEFARSVCEGCDAVVHTAAKAGVWGRRAEYFEINYRATLNLLEGARAKGVRRFVHTSSPSVTFQGRSEVGVDETAPYGRVPLNAYCASKIAAEREVFRAHREGPMRCLALRPHLIYGPGDPHLLPRLFEAANLGRLARIGPGDNLVDVTHIRDTVQGHLRALEAWERDECWGEAYFLTSGRPIRLWEWIGELLSWKGLSPVRGAVPLPLAAGIGLLLEGVFRLLPIGTEPPLTLFSALQLGLSHTYSIEKARTLLGYEPEMDPWSEFGQQLL